MSRSLAAIERRLIMGLASGESGGVDQDEDKEIQLEWERRTFWVNSGQIYCLSPRVYSGGFQAFALPHVFPVNRIQKPN